MSMFIYICQTPPHFQFTKTLNNWNSEKVRLVVCGCLLVVCGRLVVVCSCLLVCGRLLLVCGRLLVACDSLWWSVSFAVVACFSNYGSKYPLTLLEDVQTIYFFEVFYFLRLFKPFYFFKVFYFF